jgi:hypothetical protein
MRFNKFVEYLIILCLLIATIASFYVLVISIVFKDPMYAGFYSSWQFPMLLAILIDASYYKHLSRLSYV